jgi:hypothetical protein
MAVRPDPGRGGAGLDGVAGRPGAQAFRLYQPGEPRSTMGRIIRGDGS